MLIIGEIVGAHGIRGEVKVYPWTDFPQRFFALERVTVKLGDELKVYHIAGVRAHKNLFILAFREIVDRNQAEALRGGQLVIDYQQAVPLPEGHYYDYQLVGMAVIDGRDGSEIGILTEVLHLPANAVYRVDSPAGKCYYVPALKEVVKKVDVESKTMTIVPLKGLLE